MCLSHEGATGLLDICEGHISKLKWEWQEEPFICVGCIPGNPINVKAFITNGYDNTTLDVESDNHKVINYIHLSGKTNEICKLFNDFFSECHKLNCKLKNESGEISNPQLAQILDNILDCPANLFSDDTSEDDD